MCLVIFQVAAGTNGFCGGCFEVRIVVRGSVFGVHLFHVISVGKARCDDAKRLEPRFAERFS